MKIFTTTTENVALLGVTREQSMQNQPFNRRNVFGAFILTFCAILNLLYFSYDAETFSEYALSAYTTLTAFVSVVTFFITIWQMRLSFELIQEIEMILNMSEWTLIGI